MTSIETVVSAITGMMNEGGGEELELSWELELGGNCLAGTFDAGGRGRGCDRNLYGEESGDIVINL